MPLFYFNVDDGAHRVREKFGVELSGLTEATVEAAELAGELLRSRPRDFWNTQEWKLTVENGSGMVLFTIIIAAIVAPATAAALPRNRRP
jgi:hypothetical protein